jgi:fungal STAND N-terminal Goodbye domain/NACHT domain
MDVVQEEINAAVARYETDTKHKLSGATLEALRTIKTPEELAAQIEAAGANFSQFRSQHRRLWSTLKTFVQPLVGLSKVAQTPASVVDYGAASSAVLGAVVYLIKACDGVSDAYDWAEQVFVEMQDFSTRLDIYVQIPMDASLRRKIAAILRFMIEVIGRCEQLIKERRFRQYLKVLFLNKDKETVKMTNELNKLFGSEQQLLVAVTYATTQRTEENTKEIGEGVQKSDQKLKTVMGVMKDTKDKTDKAEEDSLLQTALNVNSAADHVVETFVKNKKALLPGTGDWLLHEEVFSSWMDNISTVLWIFGGPGTGKSYLSTWIIKQFEENPDRKPLVGYFYVKENNESLRDANTILKTLAWQITDQNRDFKRHAIKVCGERSKTVTAVDTWEALFADYFIKNAKSDRNATLIIDGLDEATPETRQTLLQIVKDLVTPAVDATKPAIQFAIIGRASLRGDMDFKLLEKLSYVEVSRLKNQNDIDSYIKKRLEEFQLLHEMRKMKPNGLKKANKLGVMIAKKVSDGADGVFLWAKLLLDSLVRKDRAQIEDALKNPPSSIDDMIQSVFKRLSGDEGPDHEVLRKMLLFVTYSRRPLMFEELDIATSLPSKKPNYLLWKQTRGLLSSVFDLKFPDGIDPDIELNAKDDGNTTKTGNENAASSNESNDHDHQDFDFTGSDDDNKTEATFVNEEHHDDGGGGDNDDDDDDIFASRQSTAPKVEHEDDDGDGTDDDDEDDAKDGADDDAKPKDEPDDDWKSLDADAAEEDLFSHLSYAQRETEVTFCHQRISDYLVREGTSTTRRHPALPIIPLSETVEVEITITCLDIFRLEASLKDDTRLLCDYPLVHMVHHLEKLNTDNITQEQLIRILDGLYWLFGTEKGALCHISAIGDYDDFGSSHQYFWDLWVSTDEYLKLLQTWFKKAESVRETAGWSEEAYAWIASASTSLEILLKPLMKVTAADWLSPEGFGEVYDFQLGFFQASVMHGLLTRVSRLFLNRSKLVT